MLSGSINIFLNGIYRCKKQGKTQHLEVQKKDKNKTKKRRKIVLTNEKKL